MTKTRIFAVILLIAGLALGYFIYTSEANEGARFPFHYGLDLDGGTHLTYGADTSQVDPADIDDAMDSLRRTIERRINVFGVSEPIIQVEKGSVFSGEGSQHRLSVELPGVTDINEAIDAIGKTPVLEFRLAAEHNEALIAALATASTSEQVSALLYSAYQPTGLGGTQLSRAQMVFDSLSAQALVTVEFNSDGAKLFGDITKANIGRQLGIFLDGELLSSPVINQEIIGGSAQISGNFTPEEARTLAQDLSLGALPLPIELIETQTVGASLGQVTLNKSIYAFFVAFIAIAAFLILWYRLPGLLASIALIFYILINFALFKVIPVTLTAAGLAGFILSMGIAVDANVIIFERIKEELKIANKSFRDAIRDGFKRAWPPVRDGHLSGLFSAIILYWLSGTSLVQGFALVFGLGIIVSLFSAVTMSRTLLLAVSREKAGKALHFLFSNGFSK